MTISERIRTAPNGTIANRLLPDNMSLVRAGESKLWTFCVNGNATSFPESFSDALARAARHLASTAQ